MKHDTLADGTQIIQGDRSTVIRSPDGMAAILCHRGSSRRRSCYVCNHDAPYLCDGPGTNGGTCDRPLCEQHRIAKGNNRDLCKSHDDWERSRTTAAAGI